MLEQSTKSKLTDRLYFGFNIHTHTHTHTHNVSILLYTLE